MRSKTDFTLEEADLIRRLLDERLQASRQQQKNLRQRIRNLGFYLSDFPTTNTFSSRDFDHVVKSDLIRVGEQTPKAASDHRAPTRVTEPGPKPGALKNFSNRLKTCRNQFRTGKLVLLPGESVNDAVTKQQVPEECGVYVIFSGRDSRGSVLYIGKSGTLESNGQWKRQRLRRRLCMKQGDEYRRDFFRRIIAENDYDGLCFEYFITIDNDVIILPLLVEAELLQSYFEDTGRLPGLNKSA